MKFKLCLFAILLFLASNETSAQYSFSLDKKLKIDTLFFWVNYPEDFDVIRVIEYDSILNSVVSRFNQQGSFVVKLDSASLKNWIVMDMKPIKYASTTMNVVATAISLALIGGHVYVISTFGLLLPIWPVLMPGPISKIKYSIDPEITTSKPYRKSAISTNGYLMKKAKQEVRFKKKFNKSIYHYLNLLNNQHVRNAKRNAQ